MNDNSMVLVPKDILEGFVGVVSRLQEYQHRGRIHEGTLETCPVSDCQAVAWLLQRARELLALPLSQNVVG